MNILYRYIIIIINPNVNGYIIYTNSNSKCIITVIRTRRFRKLSKRSCIEELIVYYYYFFFVV